MIEGRGYVGGKSGKVVLHSNAVPGETTSRTTRLLPHTLFEIRQTHPIRFLPCGRRLYGIAEFYQRGGGVCGRIFFAYAFFAATMRFQTRQGGYCRPERR